MKLRYKTTAQFERHYQERIAQEESLVEDFIASVDLFFQDPQSVNDHGLRGVMKHYRAFWMNDAYRVIYRARHGDYLFVDIGTHEQVYIRRLKTSRAKGKELL